MDHGEKDTGEGGAQAEVVEPIAQRDRRRAARVESQRLRRAQGRGRARRRLGGGGTDERWGGVRPPVPGARAAGAGVPGPGLGRGPRRAREGRRHAQAPVRRDREECAARGEAAMSYDRFCKRYRQFAVSRNVVSRVGRKAGRNMEVDWSGPTMPLVDQASIWVTVLRVIS